MYFDPRPNCEELVTVFERKAGTFYLRDGHAVEDDHKQGDDVHDNEHSRSDPECDNITSLARRDAHLHERNTKLDRYNCNAVKDFEK